MDCTFTRIPNEADTRRAVFAYYNCQAFMWMNVAFFLPLAAGVAITHHLGAKTPLFFAFLFVAACFIDPFQRWMFWRRYRAMCLRAHSFEHELTAHLTDEGFEHITNGSSVRGKWADAVSAFAIRNGLVILFNSRFFAGAYSLDTPGFPKDELVAALVAAGVKPYRRSRIGFTLLLIGIVVFGIADLLMLVG